MKEHGLTRQQPSAFATTVVLGGMTAWNALKLPTEKGRERSVPPDGEGERN